MREVGDDEAFRVVSQEALVRMKLTSYRFKDRVHLFDMIEVGLAVKSCHPSTHGRKPFKSNGSRREALFQEPFLSVENLLAVRRLAEQRRCNHKPGAA